MSRLPLIDGTISYRNKEMISFCMPGHKGGRGFLDLKEKNNMKISFEEIDTTEVLGVDNLHSAEGVIKESLELLSSYYKSTKSYYLINGTTSGNLIMIYSCFNEGDKVLVDRNCHKSIINGIILKKLRPIYLKNAIHKDYLIPLSIDRDSFIKTIEEHKDAKGIIMTYPNYYGVGTDLKFIIEEASKYQMKVLVDSAHGAHFTASKKLPPQALLYKPTMATMSAHKTLPALNQGSYLHICTDEENILNKVDFYFKALTSTSPSYPIMCSLEYSRDFLEEEGEKAYEELLNLIRQYRTKINALPLFHILDENDIKSGGDEFYLDETKLNIMVKDNCSGFLLYEYLLNANIQCEMSTYNSVNLICTPFNTREDFERLYLALLACSFDAIYGGERVHIPFDYIIPRKCFEPYEMLYKKSEDIDIEDAYGRVCFEAIVPYPPGVPILNPGEIIDKEHIEIIKFYRNAGLKVLGLQNKKIKVVRKE